MSKIVPTAATSPAPQSLGLWLRAQGLANVREIEAAGFTRMQISRCLRSGEIERVSRGLYGSPDASAWDEQRSLLEACRRHPRGVLCLLSALFLHGLGSEQPNAVWMALPRGTRRPVDLRIELIQAPDWALAADVEIRPVAGGELRLTSLPRTLVDCFKHRGKIGLEPALEALRQALRERRVKIPELEALAARHRVLRLMRPYLEALA
jgi:predicted transcriptional regulator of viral defense system